MKQKPIRKTVERVPLAEFVRGTDENNLAEFPLALLSDSRPAGQKTIEFQDTLKDWKSGREITRRVCVTGSDKYGLPTSKDDQVLVALLQLTRVANNFSSPEVSFSKHQVIELLGWSNSGWAYDRVEESLHRWKGVSVHYWNAWRDHDKGAWVDTEAVGIIDYFRISDGRRNRSSEHTDKGTRFVWNRELFKSFKSGYLKPLDFGLYRSLKLPAAKRALRFLEKRFHHRPNWKFDLYVLCCDKLGFSRNYDTGQLKERLNPAMAELEEAGFISPIEYEKVCPRIWNVLVSQKARTVVFPLSGGAEQPMPLAATLVTRGISKQTADELVKKYPRQTIEEKLAYFDWMMTRNDRRVSANPPGFLVASKRKDYTIPREFNKSQKRKAFSKPTARPALSSVAAREPKQEVTDYIASLRGDELARVEAAALASADTLTADGYRRSQVTGGPVFLGYQQRVLENYVGRLLQECGKSTNDEDC